MTIEDEKFKFAYLDDIRQLIAALKAQRWDGTKWYS